MSIEPPEQIASLLDPAAALAEQGFLAAGQSLERAVEILDRLTQRFAAYVAQLTEGALDETSSGLTAASARIATLADSHQSDLASLEPLARVVAAIDNRIAALQPRAQEVATLSLSARVVAGGMGAAGADFLAFSESIKSAADRVRSSLQDVRRELSLVDQDLRAASSDAAAFAHGHGQTMRSVPARLAANSRGLTEQQGLAVNAAAAARQGSENVRRDVANQIVALQLGDVIRQRVEHVQAAVRIISAEGSAHARAGQLLAAQLRDAAAALREEGARIEARLTQLATAAHDIGQLAAQLRGAGAEQKGGFVANLEADIRRTVAPLAELRVADAANDRRMAAVLSAADQLAARLAALQSAEEDIRIMGLNATLKCGRLGQVGLPLAAVAQELRACGRRFAGDASAALSELERLRSLAASLRDPARAAKHAALATAMEAMLSALRHLGQLENEMASALAQLRADADAVGRLVEDALSRFAVHRALGTTLCEAADAFEAWTEADEDGTQDILDRIALSYTMVREREVHARVAPLPRQLAGQSIKAAPAELADFLF